MHALPARVFIRTEYAPLLTRPDSRAGAELGPDILAQRIPKKAVRLGRLAPFWVKSYDELSVNDSREVPSCQDSDLRSLPSVALLWWAGLFLPLCRWQLRCHGARLPKSFRRQRRGTGKPDGSQLTVHAVRSSGLPRETLGGAGLISEFGLFGRPIVQGLGDDEPEFLWRALARRCARSTGSASMGATPSPRPAADALGRRDVLAHEDEPAIGAFV